MRHVFVDIDRLIRSPISGLTDLERIIAIGCIRIVPGMSRDDIDTVDGTVILLFTIVQHNVHTLTTTSNCVAHA